MGVTGSPFFFIKPKIHELGWQATGHTLKKGSSPFKGEI
jgi:hypothetical protein